MPHYLLIEFDEVEQCNTLRERIDNASKKGKALRVIGLFRSPKSWCTCPIPTGYHKGEIVRGGRFGWWIHLACKKARMGSHHLENLLELSEVIKPSTGIMMRPTTLGVAEVVTNNFGK